jgi:hypothetical protein
LTIMPSPTPARPNPLITSALSHLEDTRRAVRMVSSEIASSVRNIAP